MHYAVIPADNGEPIRFEEAEAIDLDTLYRGTKSEMVQAVDLSREGDIAHAWMDEEGKLNGKPVNRRADDLLHEFSGIAPDDVIVGDVVFTGGNDEEGETLGLTESWRTFLAERFELQPA